MGKVQVLALIHERLKMIGLGRNEDKWRKSDLIINWLIITLLFGFLTITVEYIVTHADDLANFMYAVMQLVTFVTVWTCYICFALQKTSTSLFFTKLQAIVERSCKCLEAVL